MPPAKPYHGTTEHYACSPADFAWHQWHGRRFTGNGRELHDYPAVAAAIARGDEVWSR